MKPICQKWGNVAEKIWKDFDKTANPVDERRFVPYNRSMKASKKIWTWIAAVLKGTLVGLAVVIPGVSGGSMLLTIGVYEDAVSITSKDRDVRKKAMVKLIPYALGIVFGVAALSFVITWLLAHFELYTILLFCGLILGALPLLLREVRGKPVRLSYLLTALAMIAIMVALPIFSGHAGETFEQMHATDAFSLNDRIVLLEEGAPLDNLALQRTEKGVRMTVSKRDFDRPIWKIQSANSGLSGLRASVSDGVLLENEATELLWPEQPVDLNGAWTDNDALLVEGMRYTVYRAVDTLSDGLFSALLAAVLGFVAAGTMIVPGISGSMVLLVLGYYNSVMTHLKGAILAGLSLDFSALGPHLVVLVPFAVGVLAGLLLVSKAIKWLFDRHPTPTYYAIIGLMLASPVAIPMKSNAFGASFLPGLRWYTVVIGLLCLAAGFILASRLSEQKE